LSVMGRSGFLFCAMAGVAVSTKAAASKMDLWIIVGSLSGRLDKAP
jgi:hypothetical protein